MSEPTPQEVGLPDKFTGWREHQWWCIENGVTCADRFDVHCVPTGGGKSPSYMAQIALSMKPGERVAIVTATKGLEDQVMHEFSGHFPMVNIRGRDNPEYQCSARPGWTCGDGHAGQCPNAGTYNCSWTKQYFKALTSPIVVTNYAFWVAIHKYGHGLGTINHLYMDEAHEAFKELSNAVQMQVSSKEVEDLLGQKFPKAKDDLNTWKAWASPLRQVAQEALKELKAQVIGAYHVKVSQIRELKHLQNLVRRLGTLATIRPRDWIVDDWEHGFQFDSIRPSRYAESHLYRNIPRVTMFSATITPKVLEMVGVYDNYSYWEYPSIFNPEGDPVMHVPTCYVNKQMTPTDMAVWLMRADQAIGQRLDRKGLFHTVSHERAKDVYARSDYARMMYWNKKGDITSEVVERYMRAEAPAVMLSPSIMMGWDFMHDLARYQIIGKIPWPNIKSKLYEARSQFDPLYGPLLTMQSFVQACGRVRRAENDWGETIVLDDGMYMFLKRYRRLAPSYFHRRCQYLHALPPPPPLERAA